MSYRLGVDIGGTFTDLILIDEQSGRTFRAKEPSTPKNLSVGVLRGIDRVCKDVGIEPNSITHVLHGTTIATNTILEGKGARVGLVTTEGFRQTLQIARSHIPGGLGSWVVHPKNVPLAPLELTIEARERVNSRGEVIAPLDEPALRQALHRFKGRGVEAITVSLFNSFAYPGNERRVRDIVMEEIPGVPVSISSEVLPEMLEYERMITTVTNSYIRPRTSAYVENLGRELARREIDSHLHILRSDGGLTSTAAAMALPVNILMSGPAGGVSGALWVARQAGYGDLLTLDMGGTSTDVALIENGTPRLRRETTVGDVTVRASSLDVRTVGAGGGSIAFVPELTGALRVGPESAGADPGPAAYGRGGTEPTVTDANLVLGYLPRSLLGGEMELDLASATRAMQKIADGLGLGLKETAAGVVAIVNEAMFGALRLVSIQRGYDPRDFALVAFGGAGPLHANALAKLMGSWPAIIPLSPGILCAFGDATTALRNEASRTFIRRFAETSDAEIGKLLFDLAEQASRTLDAEAVPRDQRTLSYEVDCRYHGQGLQISIPVDIDCFKRNGLAVIAEAFDVEHEKLFTFALREGHELVNLRAVAQGATTSLEPIAIAMAASDDPAEARIADTTMWVDGGEHQAPVYGRSALKAGHRMIGPAIVSEMDSTTLILPDHIGEIDSLGNIIIRPKTG